MKVSVIIPAYNALRWLPETLASVEAQAWPDMELIIVDDGSTDETGAYVREHWPQARYVRTENKGVSHARNVGTQLATGDLVQYLDADDVLLPGKIARQVPLLKRSGANAVYGNWQRYEQVEDGSFLRGEEMRRSIADVSPDVAVAFFTSLWCPTGAYLYERTFLSTVPEWKEWLPVIQDARFTVDATMAGARWVHDAEIGVLYRQHRAGSVSTSSRYRFLKDCLVNAEDMRKLWSDGGEQLTVQRRDGLVDAFAHVMKGSAGKYADLIERAATHLEALDPDYVPAGGRADRLFSQVLGFRRAQVLLGMVRKMKAGALKGD